MKTIYAKLKYAVRWFLFRLGLALMGSVVFGLLYLDKRIELRKEVKDYTPVAQASEVTSTLCDVEVEEAQIKRWARAACELHKVPFSLFWSLLKNESNLDAGAVSPVGALGIAQIMPDTLRTLMNIRTGKLIAKSGDAFNPQVAIFAGAEYLARMQKQWGNWYDAIGAYNAGKNGVSTNRCHPNYYVDKDGKRAIASYTCTFNRETYEYKLRVIGGMEP